MKNTKYCPFCRSEIPIEKEICNFCNRPIIEKFEISPTEDNKTPYDYSSKQKKKTQTTIASEFKKPVNIFFIMIILFLLFLLMNIKTSEKIDNQEISRNKLEENDKSEGFTDIKRNHSIQENKSSKAYVSLRNGTIINKDNRYFKGLGVLEINNGTDSDALLKLVNISYTKSIYTVYIKSKHKYKIDQLNNGKYKIYFSSGKDWDVEKKKFLLTESYLVFEDIFSFKTEEFESHDNYSVYEITLHNVLGGKAKAVPITENLFDGL